MAFCMRCSREVPDLTVICPHCNHDFLGEAPIQKGWEYSPTADVLLLVGAAASVIVALLLLVMIVGVLSMAVHGPSRWTELLSNVGGLGLGLCSCLANIVVFMRVANLSRDKQ